MGFSEDLKKADDEIKAKIAAEQEEVRERERVIKEAEEKKNNKILARNQAVAKFLERSAEPRLKEIKACLPPSATFSKSYDHNHNSVISVTIYCGDREYLLVSGSYHEPPKVSIQVLAMTSEGSAYSKALKLSGVEQLDDEPSDKWVSEHLIAAFLAFGEKSKFIRIMGPPAKPAE